MTDRCQLSTVNCQLSTVNCQLSTVNCQLFNGSQGEKTIAVIKPKCDRPAGAGRIKSFWILDPMNP
ncbi:MAG: hypothetical protein HC849_24800, partial [Oscillatoriales cyanobacterium RU_3_3]|nr:hypothetical protein [Oscillatoriales cyanobacterium RU_3_3]